MKFIKERPQITPPPFRKGGARPVEWRFLLYGARGDFTGKKMLSIRKFHYRIKDLYDTMS